MVTCRYKIAKDKSSLFIMSNLMLLDLIRVCTFTFALLYTAYFFTHEICLRLGHDLPTFLFDCVTISVLFLFMETYDTLEETLKEQMESTRESQLFEENKPKKSYTKVQHFIIGGFTAIILLDVGSLIFASVSQYYGTTLSSVTEGAICLCETVIFAAYIQLFCRFLGLFRRGQGAFDQVKCQLNTFFVIMILLLGFRLAFHWTFFVIILNVNLTYLYNHDRSTELIVLNVV